MKHIHEMFTEEDIALYERGEKNMCWLIDLFLKPRMPVESTSPTGYFVIKQAGYTLRTNEMTINLLDDQEVTLTFADIAGNTAPAGTQVTWTVSDSTFATVTPSTDTLSALVVTTGKLGQFTVTGTDASGASAVSTLVVGFDASAPALVAGTPVSRIPAAAPTVAPTALSTDQVAALTTSQVAPLVTDQVAALSTDQVAALSTEQIAPLTTAQPSASL